MSLDEIQKLIDGATPGPWISEYELVRFPCDKSPSGYDSGKLEIDVCTGQVYPTADFIAACRTLMPKLLAVAKAAKADNELVTHESMSALDDALAALEAE